MSDLKIAKSFEISRSRWAKMKLRNASTGDLCSLGHFLVACGIEKRTLPTKGNCITVRGERFEEFDPNDEEGNKRRFHMFLDYDWQAKVIAAAKKHDEAQTIELFREKEIQVSFVD